MAVQSNGTHGPSVRFAPPKSTSSSSRINGDDSVEVEVEEYDQPESSPYESRRVILLLGPHERKHSVPEYYLRQSPIFTDILSTYPHFITKTVPCIPLPDVDDDLIHTVVHYLHTGSYQTLRPAGGSDWTKTEYRRSVLVYGAAARYELLGLQTLARKYLQKLDTHLSIFDVLGVARKVYGGGKGSTIPDYDPWFFEVYVRGKMADAFVEDRDLFERPRFQYLLGAETGFDRFLVQALVWIYEARIAELEKRAVRNGGGGGLQQRDDRYEDLRNAGVRDERSAVVAGLEDIAEEYPDERTVALDEMDEVEGGGGVYERQHLEAHAEDLIDERPPSSAHVSEGYPVSVAEEPIEDFQDTHTTAAAAAAAGSRTEEYGEELPAERYTPIEQPIKEEEPIPHDAAADDDDDDRYNRAEPLEPAADDTWNGWGSWAARTREWGYTTVIHEEEPAATDPDPIAEKDPLPEPVADEPLPDYAEVQQPVVVSEDHPHAHQENQSPLESGKKKDRKKDRKKRSTMSRTRALFSSAEEQPREQAVF
ncbi:uncharacterized protein BO66DRAFT_442555 [Aspergillus aculeatinus CBS 121060]|uniref:Uncharacterized protein n=1 Tax=Aspergillus aculeatinus CBS 121060 TaxID=1448322 RepID=A0ACD1GXE8_9EURO|nr:hypothetical protein BO66DRAFT_442555 [Aspergillus aculeatinus CBS 121060]RAH66009.1 hypothetical protein BO66DRAFT_442555 [Aspergillus aculeatinus CBS 121060]